MLTLLASFDPWISDSKKIPFASLTKTKTQLQQLSAYASAHVDTHQLKFYLDSKENKLQLYKIIDSLSDAEEKMDLIDFSTIQSRLSEHEKTLASEITSKDFIGYTDTHITCPMYIQRYTKTQLDKLHQDFIELSTLNERCGRRWRRNCNYTLTVNDTSPKACEYFQRAKAGVERYKADIEKRKSENTDKNTHTTEALC